jgi:malonyl-CoA decarboxylase
MNPLKELKKITSARRGHQLILACRRLLSVRAEANSPSIALSVIQLLDALDDTEWATFFDGLSNAFSPDPQAVLLAAQAYAKEPSPTHLQALTRCAEPSRQELFRRLNRAPNGTAALIRLRRHLLRGLKTHPNWQVVEDDLLHLLGSWFNPGFLEMRRVDWNSPAHLLEQIIAHEAVHTITGWDDLRRRLAPDRRCFAFFHPQLLNAPLIFVEVALLPAVAGQIEPLINQAASEAKLTQCRAAIFYSISNCEPGLRGVSLGNFLIKRVAEALHSELPQLKTFATLSPIPGFLNWLQGQTGDFSSFDLKPAAKQRLSAAHELIQNCCRHDLSQLKRHLVISNFTTEQQAALLALCAVYLSCGTTQPGGDPVARFHLDNGATLDRINPRANLSDNGLSQSAGLMVNYLYDLSRVEQAHEDFVGGQVTFSKAVGKLI